MAKKATTLHDNLGNELLPVTNASITYMDDGNTVQAEIQDLKEKTQYNKGHYTTEQDLLNAYPNNIENPQVRKGWYAIIGETDSVWIWDIEGNEWKDSGVSSGGVESVNGLDGEVILTGGNINATATINDTSKTELINKHLTDIYSELDNKVDLDSSQLITGTKVFTETIGLANTSEGTVDQIKHINSNFLITSGTGQNLLNIDEGLGKISAFNRELAYEDEIAEIQGNYATKDELSNAINNIDLSSKADVNNGSNGFNAGLNATSQSGGAIGYESSSDRGFAGGNSSTTEDGGSVGDSTVSVDGGAVGKEAYTTNGGAIGSSSISGTGGAIGQNSYASSGFSGGYNAIAGRNSSNQIVDTIQLGAGTNSKEKSLQVYGDNIYDSVSHTLTIANIADENGENKIDVTNLATKGDIATSGGKIDSISVNGVEQTITNKNVDISVPTNNSQLINGQNYQNKSEVETLVNNSVKNCFKYGTTTSPNADSNGFTFLTTLKDKNGNEAGIYAVTAMEKPEEEGYSTNGVGLNLVTSNGNHSYLNIIDSPSNQGITLMSDGTIGKSNKSGDFYSINLPDNNGTLALVEDLDTKQDTLTASQLQAVNSGATSTNIGQITTNSNNINTINSKIPNQASSTNQLADKDFVNSSLNSITAFYITSNADGDPFTTKSALTSATTYYSGGQVATPTRNDYAIVLQDETKDNATTRYIYYNQWEYQYTVNETALTAEQLSAINSGITSTLVGKITTNENDIDNLQTNKVDKTTTINGKNLSANITLNANDVGALPSTTKIPSIEGLASETYVNNATSNCLKYGYSTSPNADENGVNVATTLIDANGNPSAMLAVTSNPDSGSIIGLTSMNGESNSIVLANGVDEALQISSAGSFYKIGSNGDMVYAELPNKSGTLATTDDIPDTSNFASQSSLDTTNTNVANLTTRVSTNETNIAKKLDKVTYEYNRELAIGSTGKVLVGKFPMYDSNVTIEVSSTTTDTYNGTLVIATQNINDSHGGNYKANVYGDPTGTLSSAFVVKYPTNSRVFEVYCNFPSWSKNLIHIKAVALSSAPSNIVELVSSVPTDSLVTVNNVLLNAIPKIPTNYVTTDTKQNVTASKVFTKGIGVGSQSDDYWTITGDTTQLTIGKGKFSDSSAHTGYSPNITLKSTGEFNVVDSGGRQKTVAYTTDIPDTSSFAKISDIPTNNNQLTNGAGYVTSSGSVASATKATQDGNGNNIVNTYATKTQLGTQATFSLSGTTLTITPK